MGIACPSAYPVAVSSLGFQLVHLFASAYPSVVTHRIVLDKSDGNSYPTKTIEEGLAIKSLDAIFFSVSFENDYLHLVRMLDAAGIPVLRRERKALPLIILGGVAPTANPEPLANIADVICIGSAEKLVPDTLDAISETVSLLRGARFSSGREQFYELLDSQDGFYVPELWSDDKGEFQERNDKKVIQQKLDNLDEYPSYSPVISPHGVYGAKNLIEISRGCPAHCRFCLLSYMNRTLAEMSMENILQNARKFSPEEASIGLISSRVSDHPDIIEVINTLASEGYKVSVSSLRVSTTSDALLEALYKAGTRSVAYAPEHGSLKIRKLINKTYSYDDVLGRLESAFDAGVNRVKLYFLTGFEEETEEDLLSTVEYIRSLIDDSGLISRKNNERLTIGIAPFVPKATTPMQCRPMQNERALKSKIRTITSPFRKSPRVEIEIESPRTSVLQGILWVAGRDVTEHLLEVSRSRGSLLASWDAAISIAGDGPVRYLMETRDASATYWRFIKR